MIGLSAEVADALDRGRPVVALESTIFSNLGLPSPANRQALTTCVAAIRAAGVVPALTAVIDGVAVVGVEPDRYDTVCGPARKVAERDLPVALGQGWDYGATTVSASVRLAASAGIGVFATGGVGGVHRDVELSMDVSADLRALAIRPVVTVASGAKVFLDLARTLEYLETWSVPVLGYRTTEFPAFYATSSGLPVPHRVDAASEVAHIARAHWGLGGGGVLVANPVPGDAAIQPAVLAEAVDSALTVAAERGVLGAAITPLVLAEIARLTDGRSIAANLALAESNARLAAEIATALADPEWEPVSESHEPEPEPDT